MTEVNLLGKDPETKARILTYYLQRNPEGIMVRISNVANPTSRSQGTHTLVFNKSTYPYASSSSDVNFSNLENQLTEEEMIKSDIESIKYAEQVKLNQSDQDLNIQSTYSEYDQYFTVTDPGTGQAYKGDNVRLDLSHSYQSSTLAGGGIPHIVYLQFLD
jgi:hypothetical protein